MQTQEKYTWARTEAQTLQNWYNYINWILYLLHNLLNDENELIMCIDF